MIVRHAWLVAVALSSIVAAGAFGTAASDGDSDDRPNIESPTAEASFEAACTLIEHGHFAEAEQAARELLARTEREFGGESAETADALILLADALWRGGKTMDDETLAVAQRAVAISERLAGPEDQQLVESLIQLGNVHQIRGEYAEAVPLLKRALAIAEAVLGPDHPGVAIVHNNLGTLYGAVLDVEAAETHIRNALRIDEATYGPDSADVAADLGNLAAALAAQGRREEAEPLYRRSLAIFERLYGAQHPSGASVLGNLGYLHMEMGEYELAKAEFERADAFVKEVLPPGAPDRIISLRNLALATSALGLPADALWEQAIGLADTWLGNEHELAADLRGGYASSLRDINFQKSKQLSEESLTIFELAYGPDHPRVAWALGGLAENAIHVGDYEAASRLLERAVQIDERRPDVAGAHLASELAGLAECRAARGRNAEARELFERSLEIAEEASGPEHPDVEAILMRLGAYLRRVGDVGGARVCYTRAIAIGERMALEGRPRNPASRVALADLETDTGNLDVARPLFERALALYEEQFQTDYPGYAEALLKYGAFLLAAGDVPGSLDASLHGGEITRRHLRSTVASLPERTALSLAAKTPAGIDLAISAAIAGTPANAAPALDAVIRSRALVLDEIAQRHHSAWLARDQETQLLVDAYTAASVRLAKLAVRGADERFPDKHVDLLRAARAEKEEAEQALAERSAEFRAAEARAQAGLTDIAAALPHSSVLVSYFRYPRQLSGRQAPSSQLPLDSYAALVLSSGAPTPALLDLKSAVEIDESVAAVRRRLAEASQASGAVMKSAEASYRRAGEKLRRLVWDPLEPYLHDAATVFIVPDGSLSVVSFAALPVGASAYLVEGTPRIQYLSAERDLVSTRELADGGLLAVGDPAFDESAVFAAMRPADLPLLDEEVRTTSGRVFRGQPASCGNFESLRFASLPSSRLEVDDVASTWDAAWADAGHRLRGPETARDVQLLQGAAASELAVKLAAPGKEVLHLATHGFFLGEGCPSALEGSADATAQPVPASLLGENPLLLSGLALAGANHRDAASPDEDDGILTAEEIAATNLSGVRWAVLSACDTGLGQIRAGEGVLGLRRAFQVAGAGTVIMSLWAVEDEASRQWMRSLYANRLSKGMSTVDAVHAASLEQLRERRDAGLSTHPFYWGGFVASGDWR